MALKAPKKPKFDDLDEMRKDLDELGNVVGLPEKGNAKPTGAGKSRKAKPSATKSMPEKDASPGAVLRSRMRKALGLAAVWLAVTIHPGHAGEARKDAPNDSLRALRVLISGEFKTGSAVLAIQDARKADSLLRNVPTRGPLLEAIRDTGTAKELRSRAEFEAYWDRVAVSPAHRALRGNLAAQDVDKTRIPKTYLFDSSVVVFPGWIVIRKRDR